MAPTAQFFLRLLKQALMIRSMNLMTRGAAVFHGSMSMFALKLLPCMALKAGFQRRLFKKTPVGRGMGVVTIQAAAFGYGHVDIGIMRPDLVGVMAGHAERRAVMFQPQHTYLAMRLVT